MGVQFDRDDQSRYDCAEGCGNCEQDEQHGHPPSKGSLEAQYAWDRHYDHCCLDQ